MQQVARISVLLFSIAAVIFILSLWKKNDRKRAIEELETRFAAQISLEGDEFYIGCSSPELKDLNELADVALRIGEPTILDLTGAPALTSLAGADRMPSLVSLVAIDCPALVSAEGVGGLPALLELVFTDSTALVETSAIRGLSTLKTLDFSGCLSLVAPAMGDLPVLENLYLSRCRNLKTLDVTAFEGLRQLYTDGCAGLERIAGLEGLKGLTDLDISNATGLTGLAGVEGLSELIVLDIRNVDLEDFNGIAALPKLRVLRMGGQDSIETLEPFTRLASLREIHLEACPNLRSLTGMPPGVSQYAGFTHCPSLTSLDGIESASGLEQLDVTGSTTLADIGAVEKLANLVQLSLVKCRAVTTIKSVEKLPKLVIVMLGGSGVIPSSVDDLTLSNEELIFDFAVSE